MSPKTYQPGDNFYDGGLVVACPEPGHIFVLVNERIFELVCHQRNQHSLRTWSLRSLIDDSVSLEKYALERSLLKKTFTGKNFDDFEAHDETPVWSKEQH
jgi:hypothetical protein